MKDCDRLELLGCIIDVFEDFLEDKGVWFDNPERVETGPENPAIIYGTDYGFLSDSIERILKSSGCL